MMQCVFVCNEKSSLTIQSTKDVCKASPAVGRLYPSGDDDDNNSQRADWKRKPGLSILNSKSSLCLPLLLIVMGSG